MSTPDETLCPCFGFDADPDAEPGICLCGHQESAHTAHASCTVVLDPDEPYDPAMTQKALRIWERWNDETSRP